MPACSALRPLTLQRLYRLPLTRKQANGVRAFLHAGRKRTSSERKESTPEYQRIPGIAGNKSITNRALLRININKIERWMKWLA